jgi:hypothetical protein
LIIIAVIFVVGVVVTAEVGPMVRERFTSGRATPGSPESSAQAALTPPL